MFQKCTPIILFIFFFISFTLYGAGDRERTPDSSTPAPSLPEDTNPPQQLIIPPLSQQEDNVGITLPQDPPISDRNYENLGSTLPNLPPIVREPEKVTKEENSTNIIVEKAIKEPEKIAEEQPPVPDPPIYSQVHRTSGTRLLVLPLVGVPRASGENIALFISNVSELKRFYNVLDPRLMSQEPELTHYEVPQADTTDRGLIKAGNKYNAKYVLASQLTRLGDHQIVILMIIDIETGQLISGAYREIREFADIHILLPSIVKKMVRIAEVDNSSAPSLTVLPFNIPRGISLQDGNVLAHLLIIELVNTGKYRVIRRTNGNLDFLSPGEIWGIQGGILNARFILNGNVIQIEEGKNYFLAQIIERHGNRIHKGGEILYRNISDGVRLMSDLAYILTGVRGLEMFNISIPENMVWVAGGSFLMGNIAFDEDEQPVHLVSIDSFFMSKTPITQTEYEKVMGINPSAFRSPNAPVERVTWFQAIEYCNKLSQQEGLIPAYYGSNDQVVFNPNANGYRLPTEAEWEYAARGGNFDALSFDRSGSNFADAVGWYRDNSGGRTQPVAGKQPNILGLYDMAGNVWEWCYDWYAPYQEGAKNNPTGPQTGQNRIIRGGSWNSIYAWMRSTYRNFARPNEVYRDVGFRVVRPTF